MMIPVMVTKYLMRTTEYSSLVVMFIELRGIRSAAWQPVPSWGWHHSSQSFGNYRKSAHHSLGRCGGVFVAYQDRRVYRPAIATLQDGGRPRDLHLRLQLSIHRSNHM